MEFTVSQIKEGSMPVVKLGGVSELDVHKTFDCGQCFRFDKIESSKHESEYSGIAFGKHVSFAQDGKDVYIYNSDIDEFEKIWRGYLCLDMDYSRVRESILECGKGTVIEAAADCGRGIRILRQDAYEATVSFIISQNNNIPRIKKIIEALSKRCGAPIELQEEMQAHTTQSSSLCAFPDAAALLELGEAGLYELKTGFRAKYIYDAVSRLAAGKLDLNALALLESTRDCISALCEVKGIGEKVASCVSLFGMGRYDAFPVDVWIKRVAEKYFADDEMGFSPERFGKYAGIAQQYLFYYERYLQNQ